MSIQSFTLKNYRSFVERTTIELHPLTLLFGYNNSGKSALLRALPLIADSLNGHSPTPLALDSLAVRGSYFSDLLSRITGTQEFDLELSLDDSEIHRLKWTFNDVSTLRTHLISSFRALNSNGIEQILIGQWNIEFPMNGKLSDKYDVELTENNQTTTYQNELKFEGLLPSFVKPSHIQSAKLGSIIERCQKLKYLNTRVQWLSSIRHLPLRYNQFQGAAPKHLEPDGRGVADILAYDRIFDENVILPKVSSWYEDNLQQKIVIEKQGNIFQIKLQPLDSSFRINIVDVGDGLIQALPVLVACVKASENDMDFLAIEEPESHLHPKHHAALAAHFCRLAGEENSPKLLLETHSENFLLRVQIEIAEGKLDPKLVKVYWVRQLDNGCSIAEPVTFNEQGNLQGEWERNVFYDDIELSRRLIQAQRK